MMFFNGRPCRQTTHHNNQEQSLLDCSCVTWDSISLHVASQQSPPSTTIKVPFTLRMQLLQKRGAGSTSYYYTEYDTEYEATFY